MVWVWDPTGWLEEAAAVAAVVKVVAAMEAVVLVVGAVAVAAVDLCSSIMLKAARDGLAYDELGRKTEGTERRLLGCPESADLERERVIIHSS